MTEEEIRHLALIYALDNAVRHGGKALPQPVLSRLLGLRPDLRQRAREVLAIVEQVVDEVNKLSPEDQKARLELLAGGELPAKREIAERAELPPLPNAERGRVVTRFAPNPDFVLHLGSARPAILSYEYARMYDGRFILRFEDTDPKTKSPMLEAYDLIRDDLRRLGLKWDEEYIQSLRMEIYYEYAKRLIELGGAYVCTCSREEVSRNRTAGVRCACASRSATEQLEMWERMLAGSFEEGEAVLRLKTDIRHPNPSVRDWIAFRVIDTERYPHPLVGSKYVVWPTYNFACAIDDHLMGITHILRGAEHEINTLKQRYIYEYFGWTYPTAIHFGRLGIEGAILSKSKIREGIRAGLYTGYDDIRLATLRSLWRRGILPEAIRDLMIHVGVKASTARISLENLYAINRKYLEAKANRYMFVPNPHKLKLRTSSSELIARIPRHPSYPERGVRELRLASPSGYCEIYVPRDDVAHLSEGAEFRLLGLANVKLLDLSMAEVVNLDVDYARSKKLAIIQWAPAEEAVPATVLVARGNAIGEVRGVAEPGVTELKAGEHAQLYRFGFAILEDPRSFRFIYTHP